VLQSLIQRLLSLSRCLDLYLLLWSKRVIDLLELEVRVLVKREESGHMFQRQERRQNQNNQLLLHKLNVPQLVVVEVVLQELDVEKARLNHPKSNV
jgi:hypothetical protein